MIIRSSDADEIRQLVADQKLEALRLCRIDGLTLGALLELATASAIWTSLGDTQASSALLDAVREPALLQEAVSLLSGGPSSRTRRNAVFGAPEIELFPLRDRAEFVEEKWWMFLDRFRRSLVNLGFPPKLAPGISAAFNEMADNIGKHSAREDEPMAAGLAGYHVVDGQFAFAVVDSGRGVLDSLRENPTWAHLRSSTDALVAAACEHATRRVENVYGDGFKQLFLSLVDLNGSVRLRSGDGLLRISTDHTDRVADRGFCSPLPGLGVVVLSSLKGNPGEQIIRKIAVDSFL
jgi:hypothetical protein